MYRYPNDFSFLIFIFIFMTRVRGLIHECIAEVFGTWLMVFIGTGTVAAAVTTGAQSGIWQVAVVWGFGVAVSIFLSAHVSGAHLNPAVSISLAVSGKFSKFKLIPYILSQMIGAMLSGVCVLCLYGSSIKRYEARENITRGSPNSTLSAMIFGEYFPNPQLVKVGVYLDEDVSVWGAMGAEAFGTMILMLMIRSLTDDMNSARPASGHIPFFIGFTVSCLISIIAPLTQAGFNPARDFGPRIIAACAGWGSAAIPGPHGGFWIYIVGPIFGAIIGGLLYDYMVLPTYRSKPIDDCKCKDENVTMSQVHEVVTEVCGMSCNPRESEAKSRHSQLSRLSSPIKSGRVYHQLPDL